MTFDLALRSLDGLSVGDALGAQFSVPGGSRSDFTAGRLPGGPGHPPAPGGGRGRGGGGAGRCGPRPDLLDVVLDHLGNGARSTAQDTVPFALWVAASHADDYRAAVGACVEAGGDMDTTAATVGGIVACRTGVPGDWSDRREPLPPDLRSGPTPTSWAGRPDLPTAPTCSAVGSSTRKPPSAPRPSRGATSAKPPPDLHHLRARVRPSWTGDHHAREDGHERLHLLGSGLRGGGTAAAGRR